MSNLTIPSKTLIFDVETTGLMPRGIHPAMSHKWKDCRIVQIAWEVLDDNHEIESSANYIIYPDGYTVPQSATNIHGISHEMAEEQGIPMQDVLDHLDTLLPTIQTIVAHNISFDMNVLLSEVYRQHRSAMAQDLLEKTQYCTMLKGTRPGCKWPKLSELYEELFYKQPSGTLHTADADVRICREIYIHQVSR